MNRHFKECQTIRIIGLALVVVITVCMLGCSRIEIVDVASRVDGQIEVTDERGDISYHIVAGEGGAVTVFGDPDDVYHFDEWDDIVSVSVGDINAGGIRADGTVVATGVTQFGAADVNDWHDIVMMTFTPFSAYGLKSDGTVISTGEKHLDVIPEYEAKMVNATASWRHITYINSCTYAVAGVCSDGSIVVASADDTLYRWEVDWRNVKQVDISDNLLVGLAKSGDVLVAYNEYSEAPDALLSQTEGEWEVNLLAPKPFVLDELYGVRKVCVGDTFIAGLMDDGTLKVCDGGMVWHTDEDVLALDGTVGVADINAQGEALFVLYNDGRVVAAGSDD